MSQRNRHWKWREWAAQLGGQGSGAVCPLTAIVVEGRTQGSFNARSWGLGIGYLYQGKGRKGKKEKLGRITKNKPEKFGPGQSFVVGV